VPQAHGFGLEAGRFVVCGFLVVAFIITSCAIRALNSNCGCSSTAPACDDRLKIGLKIGKKKAVGSRIAHGLALAKEGYKWADHSPAPAAVGCALRLR
jgi:hypothetical protein